LGSTGGSWLVSFYFVSSGFKVFNAINLSRWNKKNFALVDSHRTLPTPMFNLRVEFGACLGICLVIQMIVFLIHALHTLIDLAVVWNILCEMMLKRVVNQIIFHTNGASMFFSLRIYCICRGCIMVLTCGNQRQLLVTWCSIFHNDGYFFWVAMLP
jgi:hypothetical protein